MRESFMCQLWFPAVCRVELLLRKPRELAAVGSLFGLNEVSALDAVSANPVAIVRRNREKLSRGFVAPGIRVVKEGRDC